MGFLFVYPIIYTKITLSHTYLAGRKNESIKKKKDQARTGVEQGMETAIDAKEKVIKTCDYY